MGFKRDSPNFTVKDGLAYTEDNVLIRNLFIYNILYKTTEQELVRYFERYGELVKVSIKRSQNNRRHLPCVGFVNFVDPRVAAKVLQVNYHFVNGKQIGVKSCDSWHQPGVYDFQYPELKGNKEALQRMNINEKLIAATPNDGYKDISNPMAQDAPIFRLNDYCLEMICRKLPLRAQLQFARTCQRFRNVFVMLPKVEYRSLLIDDLQHLTLWEIRDFLQLFGEHVHILKGAIPRKDNARITEMLGTFCTQVQYLTLRLVKFTPSMLKKLIGKMQMLTTLRLHDVTFNDNCILELRSLKNLRTLYLIDNYEITGRYLHHLHELEELSLHGCSNILTNYFLQLCRKLKSLRSLDIQRCQSLEYQAYHGISKYCPNIEVLKFCCGGQFDFGYECVTKLAKLKHLSVLASSLVRSPLFSFLAIYHSKTLECLDLKVTNGIVYDDVVQISKLKCLRKLSCPNNATLDDQCLEALSSLKCLEEINLKNCRSITSDGLLRLIRCCKNLNKINLLLCVQFNKDIIHSIITMLQKEAVPKKPLSITVGSSRICPSILEDETYKNNLNRINILMDEPMKIDRFDEEFDDVYDFTRYPSPYNINNSFDLEEELFFMERFIPDDSDDDFIPEFPDEDGIFEF